MRHNVQKIYLCIILVFLSEVKQYFLVTTKTYLCVGATSANNKKRADKHICSFWYNFQNHYLLSLLITSFLEGFRQSKRLTTGKNINQTESPVSRNLLTVAATKGNNSIE